MNKTIEFANVHTTLEDGSVLPVMFLHKQFIFVDMGNFKVSFIPLSSQDQTNLVEHNMNLFKEVSDLDIIDTLDTMLDGRTAEEELSKLIK